MAKQKMGCLPVGCLGVIGVVVLLVIIGRANLPTTSTGGTSGSAPTAAASEAPAAPSVAVSVADLLQRYDSNEIAADAAFKGNVIEVSGEVENVGKDIVGTMFVAMKSPSGATFRRVQCMFDSGSASQLAQVQKGYSYRIIGRCDGMFGNVILKDCRFAQ